MGDPVLRALVQDDPVGMPVDLAEMMEMVVDDLVVLVDILGAGAVSEQENARAAEVVDLIARDDVPLAVEIEPDGFAAAIEEPAVLDPAFFRSPQAKQPMSLVDHRPVVLNRHGRRPRRRTGRPG